MNRIRLVLGVTAFLVAIVLGTGTVRLVRRVTLRFAGRSRHHASKALCGL